MCVCVKFKRVLVIQYKMSINFYRVITIHVYLIVVTVHHDCATLYYHIKYVAK